MLLWLFVLTNYYVHLPKTGQFSSVQLFIMLIVQRPQTLVVLNYSSSLTPAYGPKTKLIFFGSVVSQLFFMFIVQRPQTWIVLNYSSSLTPAQGPQTGWFSFGLVVSQLFMFIVQRPDNYSSSFTPAHGPQTGWFSME